MRELLELALKDYKDTLISKNDLLDALLQDEPFSYFLSKKYNLSNDKYSNFINRNFPLKPRGARLKAYLILTVNHKYCVNCKQLKLIDDFSSNKTKQDKVAAQCKECFAGMFKSWYSKNTQEQIQRVKQRQRNQDRFLTQEEIEFIFDRDEYKCKLCGLSNEEHLINFGQRLHLDHVYPLSKGGLTTIDNIQLLCRSCNSSKGFKNS